jgi:hypothetical protein
MQTPLVVLVIVALVCIARIFERRWPIAVTPASEVIGDWGPMGRMITVLNSPQWHRIHHSMMPEHRDKSFASLLPLWDILFRTAWLPKPDEYPVTGFDPPVRVSVIEGVIWPFRHLLPQFIRRRSRPQTSAPEPSPSRHPLVDPEDQSRFETRTAAPVHDPRERIGAAELNASR